MNDLGLTPEQQKALDDWFFDNPYCTHAAWLTMIEKLKNEYVESKDDGFFESLKNKTLFHNDGITMTYYLFDDNYNNEDESYIVNVFRFEVVRNSLMAYRTSCIVVDKDNCEMFRDMIECSRKDLRDFIQNVTNGIIKKISNE